MIKRLILPLCILIAFVILMILGTWQVFRLNEKEALIARVEHQLKAPPISFDKALEASSAGEDLEYRPVSVRGQFIGDIERLYFITKNGQLGWYLYQPLLVENDRVVWVNRGFVEEGVDRKTLIPTGEFEFSGLLRHDVAKKPNYFTPENDIKNNIYYWKNIAAMSAPYRDAALKDKEIVPFFIDAGLSVDDQVWQGDWPQSGVTRIEFPNSHLSYAMTWYGLALACLGVGFAFWRSRRKKMNEDENV